eukprot:10455436-Alexandrium_andersonii.AAC.1
MAFPGAISACAGGPGALCRPGLRASRGGPAKRMRCPGRRAHCRDKQHVWGLIRVEARMS